MSLFIWLAWFAEVGMTAIDKSKQYLSDLYLITFSENEWVIANSGQFADRKFFKVSDASNDYWVYSNNELLHLSCLGERSKRLPYLSCVFNILSPNPITVSMDDFLPETRCNDLDALTLPILMAAFSIKDKRLHNWRDAKFEAVNRDGDDVRFDGSTVTLVTKNQ